MVFSKFYINIQKPHFKEISFKGFKVNPDEKVDFFIEDIALIILPIKLFLRPKKKNGQFFRPIQPICLLTESTETKDDIILQKLQTKAWHDTLSVFTIAGIFVSG